MKKLLFTLIAITIIAGCKKKEDSYSHTSQNTQQQLAKDLNLIGKWVSDSLVDSSNVVTVVDTSKIYMTLELTQQWLSFTEYQYGYGVNLGQQEWTISNDSLYLPITGNQKNFLFKYKITANILKTVHDGSINYYHK